MFGEYGDMASIVSLIYIYVVVLHANGGNAFLGEGKLDSNYPRCNTQPVSY